MESKKGLTSSPSSTAQLTLSDGDVWGGPSPNLSVAMRVACRNFTHMEGEGVSAEGMNSHSYLQVLIFYAWNQANGCKWKIVLVVSRAKVGQC
jgi:hypothetical protein